MRPYLLCIWVLSLMACSPLPPVDCDFEVQGVCVAMEETAQELVTNMASLGYDLPKMIRQKKLAIDYVHVERKHIEETGEYDLEGLFIRLRAAIDQVKAKRVLLDTIELLFLGLKNDGIVRAELRRLFHRTSRGSASSWPCRQ